MNELIIENIDIPVDSGKVLLKGSIYYTSNTPPKAPFIINCAGLLDHRESYFVKYYTEKFTQIGYYVLVYDYRAHGETAKQTGTNWLKQEKEIFSDIHIVLEWVLKNQSDRLLEDKIALFGRSLGAAIILTHGYIDERAKILIALCARYDYGKFHIKFPQDIIEHVSAKYFLKKDPLNNERILYGHCKDDDRIPFENMRHIKEQAGLSDENVLIYDTGGHSFKGHRDDVFEKAVAFLKKKF